MKKNENTAVEFENVSKSYKIKGFLKNKEIRAIDDISFKINTGEIVGLLGLNGAGKTTIIKLICGLIFSDSGKVSVLNSYVNLREVGYKTKIGYIPELPYFYPFSKAIETLEFYYSLSFLDIDKDKIEKTLVSVGLGDKKYDKIKNFSKGMMQKLAIACSIIHNPQLLVYDEPTSGLDPLSIREIRNIIVKLKEEGKTVLISSHSISEVEKICDRVIIIHKGRIRKTIEKSQWLNDDLEKIFVDSVSYEN
jgi:ABC-2 type transport system ATP-binding protein